ncbi:hypothetical protein L211DRAFT_853513 [Terfezia boudieri ATCC MYA-4762]|uniref:Uncharacterized protein n=1 Tax=Terfezia boudieri ATCC MYA-4762 TaxID=1051890 RepID=A0A3N4LCB3_9PEZI|nr:hypothetical protein L211DRAFT_853513 [Terfezia boudieri ATCC MYA-4762]
MSLSLVTNAALYLQPAGTSRAPIGELTSHQDRDLRVRTLTSLLAALSPVTNVLSIDDGTVLSDASTGQQERSRRNLTTDASQTWLKVLNHVAQLLVREHEIVAVLPKRSGPTAHVNILIATDSSSNDDDVGSTEGYLIARNPRFNSPESGPGNPLGKLVIISSYQEMLLYLDSHRHVSYHHHVLGIEVLFNAIIDSYNAYMAVLDDEDSNSSTAAVTEAHSHLVLRTNLFNSFVTFYSVGKMRRRFHSQPFAKFCTTMSSIWQAQVEGAFGMAARPNELYQFTKAEMHVFEGLLLDCGAKGYPALSATLSSARAANTAATHTKDTAWDLHRLLLSVLGSAQLAVDNLYSQIASPLSSFIDLSASLSDVQYTIDRLHFLVHLSPLISAHMKSIESVLSNAMDINTLEEKPGIQSTHDGLTHPITAELDVDDGITDSTIEISLARKHKRVGEECLWLAVRYQAALESLTALDSLPADRVTFTLCEVSAEDTPKTDMHDWKDVMRSIYHPPADCTRIGEHGIEIRCEEAIEALEEWAVSPENRVRATHILRSSQPKFYGSWHAEAVLGTLRHVSQHAEQTTLPGDIDLTQFEHTFNSIGVSKRCCPVCTKLLRLLTPPCTSECADNGMVFSSHQNVYPTALPPYLPKKIAVQLLVWLQTMVKNAVDGLVVNRRLAVQRSREGAEGQRRMGRARSADSKGESPGKKGKRKRPQAPGMGETGVMSRLGL